MASDTDCESEVELISSSTVEADDRERKRRWRELWSTNSRAVSPISIPRDRGHVVYVCMLVAGAGFLFPWSSYVTAIDYFFFLYWNDFHQVNHSSSPLSLLSLPVQVSVVIPMTYLVSTWLFTGVNISLINTIPLHVRIGLGYVLFLVALATVPILDVLVHSCLLSLHAAYYLTILSVAIVGIGSGGPFSLYSMDV